MEQVTNPITDQAREVVETVVEALRVPGPNEGNIVAGDRLRTSEILLHLEIYKANPRARAVVHCPPPYATAFSITGAAPPIGLISEYEIVIGPAALARYETPGTKAFAETVLPYARGIVARGKKMPA